MMGHREVIKGGDEVDAFTGWRKLVRWKAGRRKEIKRRFNKRIRKQAKLDLKGGEE